MPIIDYYVTTDAMGSVMAVMDESGKVLERRSYDAFGEATYMLPDGTVVPDSPTGVDIGFQGQLMDKLTGMYQMGFRWYSPVLGRWVSRDPIGLDGGCNFATFVQNSPVTKLDLYGLSEEMISPPTHPPGVSAGSVANRSSGASYVQPAASKGAGAASLYLNITNFLSELKEVKTELAIAAIWSKRSDLCSKTRDKSEVKAPKGCGCCVITLTLAMSIPSVTRYELQANFTFTSYEIRPPGGVPTEIVDVDIIYLDKPCKKTCQYVDYENKLHELDDFVRTNWLLEV